jgi:hypothetical protein
MARRKAKLPIVAELDTSGVEEGVKKATKATKKLRREVEGGGNAGLKAYGELAELFTGVLPRSTQSLIRSFRMTQRSVNRTARSFNFLKKAATPLIFTALIIAIEALIENFEKVTDLLGFTSQAMRDQEESTNAAAKAVAEFNARNLQSIDVINDLSKSETERQFALDELKKSLEGINDVQLDQADALDQVNIAYTRQQELIDIQAQKQTKQRQLEQALQEAEEERRVKALDYLASDAQENADRRYEKFYKERVLPLEQEIAGLQSDEAERRKVIADRVEEERLKKEALAKAERTAEQERKQREADEKKREALREELAKKESLRGLEGEARIIRENEIALEAELERARAFGAHKDDLLRIEAEYQAELDESLTNFREQQSAKADADDERKKAEALRAQEAQTAALNQLEQAEFEAAATLADDRQALDEAKVNAKYERLYALADQFGYDTAELQRLQAEELQKINDKYDETLIISKEESYKILEQGARQLFNGLSQVAEDGSATQKSLAVMEILLNQGKALSSAIAGATAAAAATGPGAPFALAGYIASAVGTVLAGFAQIRNVLDEADSVGGRFGGSSRGSGIGSGGGITQTLIPTVAAGSPDQRMNVSAFVVQSELQGKMQFDSNVRSRTRL